MVRNDKDNERWGGDDSVEEKDRGIPYGVGLSDSLLGDVDAIKTPPATNSLKRRKRIKPRLGDPPGRKDGSDYSTRELYGTARRPRGKSEDLGPRTTAGVRRQAGGTPKGQFSNSSHQEIGRRSETKRSWKRRVSEPIDPLGIAAAAQEDAGSPKASISRHEPRILQEERVPQKTRISKQIFSLGASPNINTVRKKITEKPRRKMYQGKSSPSQCPDKWINKSPTKGRRSRVLELDKMDLNAKNIGSSAMGATKFGNATTRPSARNLGTASMKHRKECREGQGADSLNTETTAIPPLKRTEPEVVELSDGEGDDVDVTCDGGESEIQTAVTGSCLEGEFDSNLSDSGNRESPQTHAAQDGDCGRSRDCNGQTSNAPSPCLAIAAAVAVMTHSEGNSDYIESERCAVVSSGISDSARLTDVSARKVSMHIKKKRQETSCCHSNEIERKCHGENNSAGENAKDTNSVFPYDCHGDDKPPELDVKQSSPSHDSAGDDGLEWGDYNDDGSHRNGVNGHRSSGKVVGNVKIVDEVCRLNEAHPISQSFASETLVGRSLSLDPTEYPKSTPRKAPKDQKTPLSRIQAGVANAVSSAKGPLRKIGKKVESAGEKALKAADFTLRKNRIGANKGRPIAPPGSSLKNSVCWDDDIESFSSPSPSNKRRKHDREKPSGFWSKLRKDEMPREKTRKKSYGSSSAKRGPLRNLSDFGFPGAYESSPPHRSNGIDPKSFHHILNNSNGEQTRRSRRILTAQSCSRRPSGGASGVKDDVVIQIDDSSESDDSNESTGSNGSNGNNSRNERYDKSLCAEQRVLNTEMTEDEQIKLARTNSLSLKRRQLGERYKLEAARIAIGRKIFSSGCEFHFQPSTMDPFLLLQFKTQTEERVAEGYDDLACSSSRVAFDLKKHKFSIGDSILEMKYFIPEDIYSDIGEEAMKNDEESEQMSFLAMKITPNNENGLMSYIDEYRPGEDRRDYIIVEVRSDDRFMDVLKLMRKNEELRIFLEEAQLRKEETLQYTSALVEEMKKEAGRRLKSLKSASNSHIQRKSWGENIDSYASSNDEVRLVYPFAGDKDVFDAAAQDMLEASGRLFSEKNSTPISLGKNYGVGRDMLKAGNNIRGNSSTRGTHYLTIDREDLERLEPGEFLNDTLIDFWMRWYVHGMDHSKIWRNEDPATSSVYFFTSHFFSTLQEEGPEAVSSWTAKKNLDIFEKRIIFLPINESLHWSLCAIVNPGLIMNYNKNQYVECRSANSDTEEETHWPFILFFDSLKAHRKTKVASYVRKWLNFEARRLNKFRAEHSSPFQATNMRAYDPKIPYQDNSWDCGVFVCRYAYSLFQMRRRIFTCKDVGDRLSPPFAEVITNSEEFSFNMGDIVRLRKDMYKLIWRLSDIYQQQKKKKGEKKSRKSDKNDRNNDNRQRPEKKKDWIDVSQKGDNGQLV